MGLEEGQGAWPNRDSYHWHTPMLKTSTYTDPPFCLSQKSIMLNFFPYIQKSKMLKEGVVQNQWQYNYHLLGASLCVTLY